MKTIHAMPEIHACQPAAEPREPRRKPAPIPAMQPGKGRHARRYTDAEVVAVILAHLGGERFPHIVTRTGIADSLVRQWCGGTVRRECAAEAERLWLMTFHHKSP